MKLYGQVFLEANKKFIIICNNCKLEIIDYNEFQDHVLMVHLDPLCTEKNENTITKSLKENSSDIKIVNEINDEILTTNTSEKGLKEENVKKEDESNCSANWVDTVFSKDVEKCLKKEEFFHEDEQSLGNNSISHYHFEDMTYEIPEPLIEINSHIKDMQNDVSSDNGESELCEHCDKSFPIDIIDKHKSRKKCGPCPVCFYKYSDLYKHLKTNHIEYCEEKRRMRRAIIPGKGTAGTKILQKKQVEMNLIEKTEPTETDDEPEQCLFNEEKNDTESMDEESSDSEKIKCNYCGRSFSSKKFELHKARRKCGKCPVCFMIVADVYAHVPNYHKEYSEEKRRLGEYVVKRLPIIGEKTFDKPDKILTCNYCEKIFKTELFYKQHVTKHEQFLNTCKECGMSFQYSSGLKRHLRKHTDERPFKCKICPASFNNDGVLKAHVSNKHTIGQKVKCTFENCGKIFKNKERKRYHELYAHYNECKHLCVDCGLRFKTSGALNKHAKTVHLKYEDREFQCKFCNLKFAFKYELDPHEMMHLGQKRYLCEFCTKGYGKKSHLRRHCQSIHGRDID